MKVFVTGGDGFVGKHLEAAFTAAGHTVTPVGGPHAPGGIDIENVSQIAEALRDALPDAIVHLAAVSSVSRSHQHPREAMAVNAVGTTALLEAMRLVCADARLLVVSSGEVYGRAAARGPLPEDAPLEPLSPYAASKVAAEAVAFQYHRSYGTHVVCARSFSHLGAGQSPSFAIPSFASQIAAIRQGRASSTLLTGDMTPIRDFLHVADVVDAYEVLLEKGVPGTAYNVASGVGRSLQSLLDQLLDLSGVQAHIEVDPARLRPVEIPVLVGNAWRLRGLGWLPSRTVEQALRDVLAEFGGLSRASMRP
jgi:GDP-4-dehydro-6-deoxy-D-mannose reductase